MQKKWAIVVLVLIHSWVLSAQINLPFVKAQHGAFFEENTKISQGSYALSEVYTHTIADGKIAPQKHLDFIRRYYPDGKIREVEYQSVRGEVESIDIYSYHPNGLMKSIGTFLPNGNEVHRRVYKYSQLGHLSEVRQYDGYGYILTKLIVEIDTAQNKACLLNYSSPDVIDWMECYYFDDLTTGDILRKEEYSSQKELLNASVFEYEQERLKTETVFTPDSSVSYQLQYHYNTKGDNDVVYYIKPGKTEIEVQRNNYNELHLITGILKSDTKGKIIKMTKISYR